MDFNVRNKLSNFINNKISYNNNIQIRVKVCKETHIMNYNFKIKFCKSNQKI